VDQSIDHHVIVLGEDHARHILDEFVRYYDEQRTHQALGGDSPLSRVEHRATAGTVISVPHLGGLHHSHSRAA
jgi:hypothetical protein